MNQSNYDRFQSIRIPLFVR